MPTHRTRTPKYRHYRPKNLAVVRISGRDHYLGKYDSAESYERYDRLIAEWLVARHQPHTSHSSHSSSPPTSSISVNELIYTFWQHVQQRYVKNGRPTSGASLFNRPGAGLFARRSQQWLPAHKNAPPERPGRARGYCGLLHITARIRIERQKPLFSGAFHVFLPVRAGTCCCLLHRKMHRPCTASRAVRFRPAKVGIRHLRVMLRCKTALLFAANHQAGACRMARVIKNATRAKA